MEYSLEQLIEQAQKQLTDPKLQDLLRAGLADRDEIEDVKRAIRFGEKSLTNPGLRQKLYKTFDRLLGIVKQDANIRSRVRADLQKQVHAKDTVVGEQAMDLTKSNVDKAIAHDCAKHVVHETWGHGQCIPGQHTLEEVSEGVGIVTHYDVMFEHGIEQDVPVGELEILVSESHMHSKKKKPIMEKKKSEAYKAMLRSQGKMAEELKHEFANASKKHPELDDDGIPGKPYYSDRDAKGKKIVPNFANQKKKKMKEEVEQVEEQKKIPVFTQQNVRNQQRRLTRLLRKRAAAARANIPDQRRDKNPMGTDPGAGNTKYTKEEVEQMDEAVDLDKLDYNKGHKLMYKDGKQKIVRTKASQLAHKQQGWKERHSVRSAMKAGLKSEEVEQVNEGERGTARRQLVRQIGAMQRTGAKALKRTTGRKGSGVGMHRGELKQRVNKMIKDQGPEQVQRVAGYIRSTRQKLAKEDVEQVDELKKSTLASYATKAAADIRTTTSLGRDFEDNKYRAMNVANRNSPFNMGIERQDKDPKKYRKAVQDMKTAGKIESDYNRQAKNRIKGIGRAAARLAKEEVDATHPKTEKEKKLAALAPPHDKITHADVMVGRGVGKKKTMKEFVELLAKRLPSEEE